MYPLTIDLWTSDIDASCYLGQSPNIQSRLREGNPARHTLQFPMHTACLWYAEASSVLLPCSPRVLGHGIAFLEKFRLLYGSRWGTLTKDQKLLTMNYRLHVLPVVCIGGSVDSSFEILRLLPPTTPKQSSPHAHKTQESHRWLEPQNGRATEPPD